MNKREFCRRIHPTIKEIRKEYNLSQLVMANMVGVSKKTYIQLEKQRIILKWSEAVTIATIFGESDTLSDCFEENVIEIIKSIAFDNYKK